MADKSFLGTGMRFPVSVNPATGRFETSSAEQSIKESIYLILMTQKTERVARPDFGASIMSYTFMDTGATMLSMMARDLQTELTVQEPRIDDVEVNIDPNVKSGCLLVEITYRVKATNTPDNLVFPFYLDATWEDEDETNDADEL